MRIIILTGQGHRSRSFTGLKRQPFATWRFIVCSIPVSKVSQTRPATSQRNGIWRW